jgi:hypothetical protein
MTRPDCRLFIYELTEFQNIGYVNSVTLIVLQHATTGFTSVPAEVRCIHSLIVFAKKCKNICYSKIKDLKEIITIK